MAKALLVMDMQQGIAASFPGIEELKTRISKILNPAREAGIQVIFVRLAFREGCPEISPLNKMFAPFKRIIQDVGNAKFSELLQGLELHSADILVDKKRVSAFAGSDLEVILRANRIDTLALCGIATSGVVLSTLREAADKDFIIEVLSDCCADRDPDTHQFLVDKIFPRQAQVLGSQSWLAAL